MRHSLKKWRVKITTDVSRDLPFGCAIPSVVSDVERRFEWGPPYKQVDVGFGHAYDFERCQFPVPDCQAGGQVDWLRESFELVSFIRVT